MNAPHLPDPRVARRGSFPGPAGDAVTFRVNHVDDNSDAVPGDGLCDTSLISAEVFADGFESGDTSAWTNTVGN